MKEINSFERISRSNEDGRGGISGHSNRKSGRSGLDARFKSERRFLSGQASKQGGCTGPSVHTTGWRTWGGRVKR